MNIFKQIFDLANVPIEHTMEVKRNKMKEKHKGAWNWSKQHVCHGSDGSSVRPINEIIKSLSTAGNSQTKFLCRKLSFEYILFIRHAICTVSFVPCLKHKSILNSVWIYPWERKIKPERVNVNANATTTQRERQRIIKLNGTLLFRMVAPWIVK